MEAGQEQDCMEVSTAKRGRKELVEKDISRERKAGLEKAKLKEWNKLLQSGAIVVHRGKAALNPEEVHSEEASAKIKVCLDGSRARKQSSHR